MRLKVMIADLEKILAEKGDVQVYVKESSGHVNGRIDVGWDDGHIAGVEDDTVATITSYVLMR